MVRLEGLSLIRSEESEEYFGKCPFCLSFLYVQKIETGKRPIYAKYIGIPTRSRQLLSYQKAFDVLFGGLPLPISYDEERDLLIIPANLFKRMVEAYGTGKWLSYEYVLFKLGDADPVYVKNLISKALGGKGQEKSNKE